MAELAAGGDLEQAMASEAISSQLKRLTQKWTICVQARETPTRKSAARIRQDTIQSFMSPRRAVTLSNDWSRNLQRDGSRCLTRDC